VRELENAVAHAFVTSRGDAVRPSDLPEEIGARRKSRAARSAPQSDRETILEALRWADGNRERASARLGISRVTLWKRMKKLAITWPPLE
jgi:two-component system response regulator HydG